MPDRFDQHRKALFSQSLWFIPSSSLPNSMRDWSDVFWPLLNRHPVYHPCSACPNCLEASVAFKPDIYLSALVGPPLRGGPAVLCTAAVCRTTRASGPSDHCHAPCTVGRDTRLRRPLTRLVSLITAQIKPGGNCAVMLVSQGRKAPRRQAGSAAPGWASPRRSRRVHEVIRSPKEKAPRGIGAAILLKPLLPNCRRTRLLS